MSSLRIGADNGESCVRALYLHLDTLEEDAECQFALLALLKHDTPDGVKTAIDEQIEELIQRLEERW